MDKEGKEVKKMAYNFIDKMINKSNKRLTFDFKCYDHETKEESAVWGVYIPKQEVRGG